VFSLYIASVLRDALGFFYKIDLLPIKKKMWSIGREMNRRLFEDSKTNMLLKFSFLRSLLGWAIVYVPNFPSGNLVDLICFLDYSSN
jgi:hypothetical protein